MRTNTLSVVLAKAGTHNPWRQCCILLVQSKDTKAAFPMIDTAYGSPRSRGRRHDMHCSLSDKRLPEIGNSARASR